MKKNIEKFLAIVAWFVATYVLHIVFQELLVKYLALSKGVASQIGLILAIIVTALLLNIWIKKIFSDELSAPDNSQNIPQQDRALQIFITARAEWNIYAIRSQEMTSSFLWLARKQIDWIQPSLSISDDDKLFLLKKVRKTDRKIDAILDDPVLKEHFRGFLLKTWNEKVMDFNILLESKQKFLELSSEERFEILENRDVLEILNEYLTLFGQENAPDLFAEIKYEDDILRELSIQSETTEEDSDEDKPEDDETENDHIFTVSAHDIEIKMRPEKFWWWKNAEHGLDQNQPVQIQEIN